jgi:ABC-type Fe3+-hydroxamate transport system substrate-binding protein
MKDLGGRKNKMPKNIFNLKHLPIRELFWLVPFIGLGLLALALFRPVPIFQATAESRTISDANGTETTIPYPFKGVVGGVYTGDFLQKTGQPQSLAKGGGPKDWQWFSGRMNLVNWVFPLVLRDDKMWNFPTDLESILVDDDGYVYFGGDNLKRFGLATISFYPKVMEKDEVIFSMTRIMNAIIGQEPTAEKFIADYKRLMLDLSRELMAETIEQKPRVLGMVSPAEDWTHLNAWSDFDQRLALLSITNKAVAMGREQDAERILAIDPDIVILFVGETESFLIDRRWQGLKAVRQNRVYQNIFVLNGYTFDLDTQPLAARWLGEIIYPDRLEPRLRDLIRDFYFSKYGYYLKDYELDWLLLLKQNSQSVGYKRFARKDKELS